MLPPTQGSGEEYDHQLAVSAQVFLVFTPPARLPGKVTVGDFL